MQGRRPAVLGGVLLIALATTGCGGPTTTRLSSPGPGASLPVSSELANLPGLGLTNVGTDAASARAAMIGPGGGEIDATAPDGTAYRLSIPADAVPQPTQIAIYPVVRLASLPTGAALTAGVQFAPDGLQLLAPATLTIELTSAPDAAAFSGLAWRADDVAAHPYPARLDGPTATLRIDHFSGAGVGTVPLAPITQKTCTDETDMETEVTDDIHRSATGDSGAQADFLNDLRLCYAGYVKPLLIVGGRISAVDNAANADGTIDAYDFWLDGINFWAAGFFPGFTVSPELADSKPLAATFIRNWYDSFNAECIAEANDPGSAITEAVIALYTAHDKSHEWGVDTQSNRLDYQTLLDNLCVQIVIDPSRGYSGSKPGDQGTVTVPVGYSIVGQPVRHDRPIDVRLTVTGSTGGPIAEADAPPDGVFTLPFHWAETVDPIQIDVLAGFDFGGTLSQIARFDRITKHAGSAQPTPAAPTPTPTEAGTSFTLLAGGANPTVQTCSVTQVVAQLNGRPVTDQVTWSASGVTVRQILPAGGSVQVIVGASEGTLTVKGSLNGQTATIDITVVPGSLTSC